MVRVKIQYFASLREQRGLNEEVVETSAGSPMDLYKEIVDLHQLSIPCDALRVAINDEFGSMDQHLKVDAIHLQQREKTTLTRISMDRTILLISSGLVYPLG